MKDIGAYLGYKWKGSYSSTNTYKERDVVFKDGAIYSLKNNNWVIFTQGQQDATGLGQVITGQGGVNGSPDQVLHSKGSTGSEFKYMNDRNGTVAIALHSNFRTGTGWANQGASYAIMNDGSVRAWGTGIDGCMGEGTTGTVVRTLPVKVPFPPGVRITHIHSALYDTYFIDSTGGLWHCGGCSANGSYQGYGSGLGFITEYIPQKMQGRGQIPANAVITRVFSHMDWFGGYKWAVLDNQGRLYVWGQNSNGSLGIGATTPNPVTTPTLVTFSVTNPIKDVGFIGAVYPAMGFITLDGTFYWAGQSDRAMEPVTDALSPRPYSPFLGKPVKKFAGLEQDYHGSSGNQYYTNCGILLEDGSLYLWGHGGNGFFGTGLAMDIWPSQAGNNYLPYKVLDGVEDFYLGCGAYDRSLALMKDGTVKAAGINVRGWVGVAAAQSPYTTWTTVGGSYLTGVTKLRVRATQYVHTIVALRSDGKAVSWGPNVSGESGVGFATADSDTNVTIPDRFVLLDKKIIDFSFAGIINPGLNQISVNYLTSDGQVYSTGYGGAVGDDESQNRYVPNRIMF